MNLFLKHRDREGESNVAFLNWTVLHLPIETEVLVYANVLKKQDYRMGSSDMSTLNVNS